MNDWYNANENRCYPFKETTSTTLDRKEIVDCKFFLINAEDTTVYLASRTDNGDELVYVFATANGNIELTVPKDANYKVVKFNEEGIGYGFVVFGDTTGGENE